VTRSVRVGGFLLHIVKKLYVISYAL